MQIQEISSSKFELSDEDKKVLDGYGLSAIFEEILDYFNFTVKISKCSAENPDGTTDEFTSTDIISEELIKKTLSPETTDKLKWFASKTFQLADKETLFYTFREAIDNQLRVVQYFKLFDMFYRFERYSPRATEEITNISWQIPNYGKELKALLKTHGSSKFNDPDVIKSNLSRQVIKNIPNLSLNLKIALYKISAALKRIYTDRCDYCDGYYDYLEKNKWNMTPYKAMEHVFDSLSNRDKKLEIPGEFYERIKNTSNFAKDYDDLISNMYSVIRNDRFFFKEITELKRKMRELDNQHAKIEKIDRVRTEIFEKTDEKVWQKFDDGFDSTSSQIKELNKNLYFAIEREWEGESIQKGKQLKHFTMISKYKEKIFNTEFDLKEELDKSLKIFFNRKKKLLKVAAILESLKNLGELDQNLETKAIKSFNYRERAKLEKTRSWIRTLNEQRGKIFYATGSPMRL